MAALSARASRCAIRRCGLAALQRARPAVTWAFAAGPAAENAIESVAHAATAVRSDVVPGRRRACLVSMICLEFLSSASAVTKLQTPIGISGLLRVARSE